MTTVYHKTEVTSMSGKNKNRNQEEKTTKTIILITVLIQLISAIINLIDKLIE